MDDETLTLFNNTSTFNITTNGGTRYWIGKKVDDLEVYMKLHAGGGVNETSSHGIAPVEAVTYFDNELILLFTKYHDDYQTSGTKSLLGIQLVLCQVLEGLSYLHSLGFSHNNLQPCHVVRSSFGGAKVRSKLFYNSLRLLD
jgi:serine/threonine protein kinase